FERGNGRHLYGRESAVVVIALDARQRIDELTVAHHETDAPARHVVAFAHGEELDRDVARAFDLHDGGRHIAVETDVGVGQVVHHQDVVLFGQRHHALEKAQVDALGRGIAGKAQDHHLGLGYALAHRPFDFLEEVDPWHHGHRANVGARNDRAVDMYGVAGVGHQHG